MSEIKEARGVEALTPLHRMTLTTPTRYWNDSCEVHSLVRAVREGATGATTNPVIVMEAIQADREGWSSYTRDLARRYPLASEVDLAWRLVEETARRGARLLEPVFESSGGRAGRLSVQVNPQLYSDPQAMVDHGEHLFGLAANLAIKVPATEAGVRAIEELTSRGVVVNATVLFTLPQAVAVAEAMERGLDRAAKAGLDVERLTPWVTIMVGRLDDHLRDIARERNQGLDPDLFPWASISVFRKAYRLFRQRGYRSTLLAAAMRSHHHWSSFIGGQVVITIPPSWQEKFNTSGVEVLPRMDDPVPDEALATLRTSFEDFRRAYEEDGLTPEEFVRYGASLKTLRQFLGGYDGLLGYVRSILLD